MKRYALLFTHSELGEGVELLIDEAVKKYFQGKKSKCSMKNVDITKNFLGMDDHDDFKEIKKTIDSLYKKSDINFMFLIDHQEDIGYVYKAAGTIDKVKEETLHNALNIYETLHNTSFLFSEIRDVRMAMTFQKSHSNGHWMVF